MNIQMRLLATFNMIMPQNDKPTYSPASAYHSACKRFGNVATNRFSNCPREFLKAEDAIVLVTRIGNENGNLNTSACPNAQLAVCR